MTAIRILIADDHPVVREGLHGMLDRKPDLVVVGEAADGIEAASEARRLRPDVILLDLVMPRKDGIAAIVEIRHDCPDARILVLTSFSDDERILAAIKAGAMGYLLKDSSPDKLVEAIREIHAGRASLPSAIATQLITELSRPSPLPSVEQPLTAREMEVLRLIAQGMPNRTIAQRLSVSQSTVRVHVSNILSKLQLANRTQAALYALQEGLATYLPPDDEYA